MIYYIKNFFIKGHSRSLDAKKSIVASFGIKLVSIFIQLIVVPLTINFVNPVQYGIWLTLSSIIAWFSFFDVGFGNGLRNKFAEARAKANNELARAYVSTTYAVLTVIFSIVWLLFFIVNTFINWGQVLNAPMEMSKELSKLAIIVFTFFCIQIVLKTINIVLIADQKPQRAALFDTIGQLLALIIIFLLTKTTHGSLVYLALAIGFAPVFVLIVATIISYKENYKEYRPSIKYVELAHAKDIVQLGAKFFIIQIAVLVIYNTSNIIIAQVSGLEDVTVYNIAFKYFSVGTMIFGIIMTPFWSAFTNAFSLGDYPWMRKTLVQLRRTSLLTIIVLLIMLAFSGTAYKLWIGDVINIRFSISILIAIYAGLNVWNSLHSLLLNGMGKIKLQLYVSLIGTIINIPLALVLGRMFGIEGVVLSGIILSLISSIYSPLQVSRLVDKKAKGIWNE